MLCESCAFLLPLVGEGREGGFKTKNSSLAFGPLRSSASHALLILTHVDNFVYNSVDNHVDKRVDKLLQVK